MGKFLNRLKDKSLEGSNQLKKYSKKPINSSHSNNPKFRNPNSDKISEISDTEDFGDDFKDDFKDDFNDRYDDDIGIQPAQKPESFHHFILENQYKDLERSIRGLKDVWDKDNQQWKTKRKDVHCFTDEEAEDILRTAQSHLATDIKLGWIRKDSFGDYMDAIYQDIAFLFESIAEYRYGRYGDYNKQYDMKLQNQKIFLELWTRIQANYSRSIEGQENKATHNSVRGQESLQSGERDYTDRGRGY